MVLKFGESASVTVRACLIGAIVLLLLIPLTMLRGLVSERVGLREQAYARVAEGWGGNIVAGGPMLVIPTERSVVENNVTKVLRSDIYLLPAQLDVDVQMKLEPQPRRVGIYAVPVYLANIRLNGRFDFVALKPLLDKPGTTYLWKQSRLRVPLSQVRSLRQVQQARFANQDIELGPAGPGLYRGIEASVDLSEAIRNGRSSSEAGSIAAGPTFNLGAIVAGSRDLSILPTGSTTNIALHSDWPHPSFQGAFLPVSHSISASGFDARWQVLEANRSYRQAWEDAEVDEPRLMESALGVALYQSVDVYQRGERAIKYAALFIALTFLTFFAWEQISGIRMHPLQYLLVGLALSTFYLLLIALSEHVAFVYAYIVAAAALVSLIGAYLASVLKSRSRGIVVGAAMTVVYGLLYVLVLSEDYALLLGAITLFAALAAVMLATRNIDWYRAVDRQEV
ncbi:MAG TPA: cell envelope integrity protein CreD [Steroidobacteraceae bacterium]